MKINFRTFTGKTKIQESGKIFVHGLYSFVFIPLALFMFSKYVWNFSESVEVFFRAISQISSFFHQPTTNFF